MVIKFENDVIAHWRGDGSEQLGKNAHAHSRGRGGLFSISAALVCKGEEVLSTAIQICQFLA